MSTPAPVLAALALALLVIAVQRVMELVISARHQRRIVARGGVEFGRAHFTGFVLLHTLYPIALALEVIVLGARPPRGWPILAAAIALAEALRYSAMRSLGQRWHTRVWVIPGESRLGSGIYRWLRHPNYVGVAIECAAIPLIFGAWRTAIFASVLNAAMLAIRIRVEERALRWAAAETP